MDCYQTVYSAGEGEISEKKSRFIANVFPVETEEDAFKYLEEIRKRYWDARHHCWAYVMGSNPSSERFSDDGEPAGTAGKPILEVIRGKKLTNTLIIVTRYFGGTLLGTGGLVRAYTSASVKGIENTVIISKTRGFKLHVYTDYTGLGKIQYILGKLGITILDTAYTDKVELTVLVPMRLEGKLIKELMEGTNGQAATEKEGECWFADTADGVRIYDR